jgi:hypothetical protein
MIMKRKQLIVLITILASAVLLIGEKHVEFICIDKWDHGDEIFGRSFGTTIDKDNHIIGVFYMMGFRLITPSKITAFAPRGQGPSEVMDIKTFFLYKDDLVVVESKNKIKIFKKERGTYTWEKTLWLKLWKYSHFISGGIFFKNRIYLTGINTLEQSNTRKVVSLIKVYDEDGKPIKNLLKKELKNPNRLYVMDYYIIDFKENLYFMAENELKLIMISPETLEVQKEIPLEIPDFYKKMPDDVYVFKRYNTSDGFRKDVEYWKTSYSRITKFINEGDYFVISIRTCSDRLKKFAVLFYNVNNFKLEKTVFIDDFLLGERQGKFYFFANGNPSLDDDTDRCLINIYSFKDKADEK